MDVNKLIATQTNLNPAFAVLFAGEQMAFPGAAFHVLARRDDYYVSPAVAMPGDAYPEVR